MTTVRILLVAALVVLGMAVVVLGLAPVAPEQALQAATAGLLAVAAAVVLVLAALVRVLAEVPEEVQELEALVLRAAQAQAAQAGRTEVPEEQLAIQAPVNQELTEEQLEVRAQAMQELARLGEAQIIQQQLQEVNPKTRRRKAVRAEEAKSKKTNKKK